jgi:hypothetical protein
MVWDVIMLARRMILGRVSRNPAGAVNNGLPGSYVSF